MNAGLAGSPYSTYRLDDIQRNIKYYPLDIVVVGATGVGKSTTLNALLGDEQAKVGYGPDPETQFIQCYMLNDYIRLWDTPGFGDSPANDALYSKNLIEFLKQRCRVANLSANLSAYLIDFVLVLVDGSSRDMNTVYTLLRDVVLKYIPGDRVLLAVNQADVAMSGRHWREEAPDKTLADFLNEKAESICRRIRETTGQWIQKPVCYSAAHRYNLYTLLDSIIDNVKWEPRES